jgi:hypothetical protein
MSKFSSKKFSAIAVTFVALALAACGAGSVGAGNTALMNGTTYSLPAVDADLAMTAALPKDSIGEELPEEGVGSIKSSTWKATLGGFTQTQRTQSLAFPPGTKITIHNLSSSITHTLDVVKAVTVTLVKAGTYEIGCAFHYAEGMRDVLVVKDGAKPGPQATPPSPKATPTPWQ